MRVLSTATAATVACIIALGGAATAQSARQAPDFSAKDENGKQHSLAEHKGKIVVLEFTNPGSPISGKEGCPFIIPRYEQKVMQNLAKEVADAGGVYLSVNSMFYNKPEDSRAIAQKYGVTHPTLQDTSGTIARAYNAKTTPHMFVINKEGQIIYEGALNSNASEDLSKEASAENYVMEAVKAAQAGETPKTQRTKSYGCGIKLK